MTLTAVRHDLDSALSTTPRLLMRLTAEQRQLVVDAGDLLTFPPRTTIVTGGDPTMQLFLLVEGKLKYYRVNHTGNEVLLWWVLPGDSFGLGALMPDPTRHIGTAETVDRCKLLAWSRKQLRALGTINDVLTENAFHILLYYLEEYTDRLIGVSSDTAPQRLVRTILQLARRTGHVHPDGVDFSITNEHLAALSNVSPFTASRHLKEWERRGHIRKRRGAIHIVSAEGLVND